MRENINSKEKQNKCGVCMVFLGVVQQENSEKNVREKNNGFGSGCLQ